MRCLKGRDEYGCRLGYPMGLTSFLVRKPAYKRRDDRDQREGKRIRTAKTTSPARMPPMEWPTRITSVVGLSCGSSHALKLSRATSIARYVL